MTTPKEILQGPRPDTPDWFKEGKEPEWSIKLQQELRDGASKACDEMLKKWEKYLNDHGTRTK